MTTIPAIPTWYRDVRFRSRLEARWAAMFDGVGWKWTYEPNDLAGWIPDFALHLTSELLVEIKPALTLDELRQHTGRIDNAFPKVETLMLGGRVPLVGDAYEEWPFPVLGLLSERPDPLEPFEYAWGPAYIHRCGNCNLLSCHRADSWRCRVCGVDEDREWLTNDRGAGEFVWLEMGNVVQWKPARETAADWGKR